MQTMKLYQITDALMNLMDDESATDEQLEEAFHALTDKAVGIACILKNQDATIEAIKQEGQRLALIKKRLEARQNWLEQYTIQQMEKLDVTELKSGVHTLKLRTNPPSVKIDDEALIPAKYIKIVQTQSIDKVGIKEAIKGGDVVLGARLESGISLRLS